MYSGAPRSSALGVDIAAAVEAPPPDVIDPMRIGATREPFSDPAWLFEMKFAGLRTMAFKNGDSIRFEGIDPAPADIVRDFGHLRAERAVVDGVLVVTDDRELARRAGM